MKMSESNHPEGSQRWREQASCRKKKKKYNCIGVNELPLIRSEVIDTIVFIAEMQQVELRRKNEPF